MAATGGCAEERLDRALRGAAQGSRARAGEHQLAAADRGVRHHGGRGAAGGARQRRGRRPGDAPPGGRRLPQRATWRPCGTDGERAGADAGRGPRGCRWPPTTAGRSVHDAAGCARPRCWARSRRRCGSRTAWPRWPEAGCTHFLELGPGRVLTGLVRQTLGRDVHAAAASSRAALEAFAAARWRREHRAAFAGRPRPAPGGRLAAGGVAVPGDSGASPSPGARASQRRIAGGRAAHGGRRPARGPRTARTVRPPRRLPHRARAGGPRAGWRSTSCAATRRPLRSDASQEHIDGLEPRRATASETGTSLPALDPDRGRGIPAADGEPPGRRGGRRPPARADRRSVPRPVRRRHHPPHAGGGPAAAVAARAVGARAEHGARATLTVSAAGAARLAWRVLLWPDDAFDVVVDAGAARAPAAAA